MYMRDSVAESHHSHLEPLYSGWKFLEILGTQQGYLRLVVGLNVELQANRVTCIAFTGTGDG